MCCYKKSEIVIKDEKESGVRAFLNYGHTFGHVIENLCGYGKWLHGEAVAMGMIAVGELAVQRGLWKRTDAKRQKQLIEKAGLPSKWPELKLENVIRSLQGDKKVKGGKVSFVMPTKIGNVKIFNDISKSPSKLEITPVSVPTSCIVAPASGVSVSFSKTLPLRFSS